MCQLLGMNCNVPTDICFSFTGFHLRGGLTDEHRDGWGIAFFEGKGVRQFLDSAPSIHSPVAELVKKYPIKSKNVIAHIRKATQGEVKLENTHPFMREIWGEYWIFAHNGHLDDYAPTLDGQYLPVGDTDSETAFCWMLQELRNKYQNQKPGKKELYTTLREFSATLSKYGEFNFILSNGDTLYAHCSTDLSYIIRKAPFAKAHLKDQEMVIDFKYCTAETDRVAVIATTPLTQNENWIKLEPGSFSMFEEGDLVVF